MISDGTTPGGHRYRYKQIGSYARAQELLVRDTRFWAETATVRRASRCNSDPDWFVLGLLNTKL